MEIVNERIPTTLKTSDFFYELPEELIAQTPAERRDESRLLVLSKKDGELSHCRFYDIIDFIRPEDVLVINNSKYNERAEILREKGTDRSKFLRGQVDKYTWIDFGDSYLPSDMNAAYLWAQLEKADEINDDRLTTWNAYYEAFKPLADQGLIEIPTVPAECVHNAHMFYLKCKDIEERTRMINHLKENGVQAVFHYIPLHSAPAGLKFGRFHGTDEYTTRESERLLRLPMYYGLTVDDRNAVIESVCRFFQ